MRVPRETTMGRGARMRKFRKGGVSCSRCSAAAKNGKTFDRGWGSQSSEWKVKSFMRKEAVEKLSTEVTKTERKNGPTQKSAPTSASRAVTGVRISYIEH